MKVSFKIAAFVTGLFFLFPAIMTFCCCVNSVSMHRSLVKILPQGKDPNFIVHTLEGMKPLSGADIFFDRKLNGSYLISEPQYLEVLRI